MTGPNHEHFGRLYRDCRGDKHIERLRAPTLWGCDPQSGTCDHCTDYTWRLGGSCPCVCHLSLAKVEEAIGEKATRWKGRCYEIADRIVRAGLVKGRAVYGHYRGPVEPRSMFYAKSALGFVQHGWVILDDGRIFDPTRWAFECKPPYLFVGLDAEAEYDEGGNRYRMGSLGAPPSAEDTSMGDGVTYLEGLSDAAWEKVRDVLQVHDQPERTITTTQTRWLAKADPKMLGPHAKAVFQWLKFHGFGAWIPIDNQHAVLGRDA